MNQDAAIRQLRVMGFTLETPDEASKDTSRAGGEYVLRAGQYSKALPADLDWDTLLDEAQLWVEALSRQAGREGRDLAQKRRMGGFPDLGAFCAFTGLDATDVFETEAGMRAPSPVHLRILDWLVSGALRPGRGSGHAG